MYTTAHEIFFDFFLPVWGAKGTSHINFASFSHLVFRSQSHSVPWRQPVCVCVSGQAQRAPRAGWPEACRWDVRPVWWLPDIWMHRRGVCQKQPTAPAAWHHIAFQSCAVQVLSMVVEWSPCCPLCATDHTGLLGLWMSHVDWELNLPRVACDFHGGSVVLEHPYSKCLSFPGETSFGVNCCLMMVSGVCCPSSHRHHLEELAL